MIHKFKSSWISQPLELGEVNLCCISHVANGILFCIRCTYLFLAVLEGNGNPLQYSRLENSMDRGAWWAAVHGVGKSQTRLSDFTFTFHFNALEKKMATHSSVLAWRIPGMGEPGGLPHRVRHNWRDLAATGLHCRGQAFSSCGKQGLLFVVELGLLIAVASLVAKPRL